MTCRAKLAKSLDVGDRLEAVRDCAGREAGQSIACENGSTIR